MMKLLLVAVLALMIVGSNPAMADEAKVKAFAVSLADKAIAVLENTDLSASGKQNRLEGLFREKVDLDWVARFVLGKHWRTASDEQKQAYLLNYKRFIIKNFTGQLADFSAQNYDVTHVHPDGEAGEYKLTIRIKNKGEPPIFMDYRLREKGSTYFIFDIIIEGVSLITTQRSEFSSVVDRKGLDFLINALEKRANQ